MNNHPINFYEVALLILLMELLWRLPDLITALSYW